MQGYPGYSTKNLAPGCCMYKKKTKQPEFDGLVVPFGGKLNPKNRWVRLAELIPWDELEDHYIEKLAGTGMGAMAKPFRMALGALIIKEKLNTTDSETVEQICENPYLQYFIGMECFRNFEDEPPFDPSMMVHFRKRLDGPVYQKANDILHTEHRKKKRKMRKKVQKQINQKTKGN